MTTKEPRPIQDTAADFAKFVQLQELFFVSEAKLAELQTQADSALRTSLDALRGDYVAHKTVRDQAEAELKEIARAHPEWKTGQTIKTPFGSVEFRNTSKLEVASEPRSVELVETKLPDGDDFLRVEKELDLEALERLDDDVLKLLGIRRVEAETVKVKPAKVDMGKAANPSTASAAKAARKGAV